MPKIDLNNLEIRTCNSNDVKDIYNIQEIVINNFKDEEKGYFLPFTEEWYLDSHYKRMVLLESEKVLS